MEIINKKHDKITSDKRVDLAAYFKIETDRNLYFSAGASREFGLNAWEFMHFINDGDRWLFYTNSEPDGFKITIRAGKNAKLICDASLVALIKKRMFISEGTKFLLRATDAKMGESKVIEILFNKPFDEEMPVRYKLPVPPKRKIKKCSTLKT